MQGGVVMLGLNETSQNPSFLLLLNVTSRMTLQNVRDGFLVIRSARATAVARIKTQHAFFSLVLGLEG